MALVPVRSKQPDPETQKHFVTEVSEDYLERWPDDYERLDGIDLARHEAKNAGIPADQIDEVAAGALALAEAGQPDHDHDHDHGDSDDHDERDDQDVDVTPAPVVADPTA